MKFCHMKINSSTISDTGIHVSGVFFTTILPIIKYEYVIHADMKS